MILSKQSYRGSKATSHQPLPIVFSILQGKTIGCGWNLRWWNFFPRELGLGEDKQCPESGIGFAHSGEQIP